VGFRFGGMMAAQLQETQAQRVERLKGNNNPWCRINEISKFAQRDACRICIESHSVVGT
jgi:hypothetical protein